ncbi:MAG TPA: alpha/beta fold hydrolase [Micromonosporaceae bacterium]
MTESMIAVDGGQVWADDSGGDLPPLVLLHPGVGDSRIWDLIRPALTPTYRVIRFDARGFGKSPAPTVEYTLLGDLVAVLDHYGIDRTPIVGCSQGGDTAIALAITSPERVSALVLLCPGISGYDWPEDPETDAEFEKAEAGGVDAIAAVAQKLWAAAGSTPEVDEQLRSAAKGWMTTYGFEQPNPATFDRLGEITVPTSLLVGDLDRPSLIECDLQIAARIPGCRLIEVPGVDHLPPLRVPDLVLRTIAETLSEPGPR